MGFRSYVGKVLAAFWEAAAVEAAAAAAAAAAALPAAGNHYVFQKLR